MLRVFHIWDTLFCTIIYNRLKGVRSLSRTTEFVLGLIGSVFGFLGAIVALIFGEFEAAFSNTGSSSITGLGWSAFIFSILAILGTVVVKSKPKLGGSFMVIAAVGGFVSIFMFYMLSSILLIIGGLMGLFKKEVNQKKIIEENEIV